MADIGATLREARLRAKIDIVEVEEATKIRAKYLRALENEEWGLLPGPAFVKSFLRTYAEYLGLDAKILVDEYKLNFERPSDLDQMPITPLGRDRQRRGPRPSRISPAWIIGVLIALLLGFFAVLGATRDDEPDDSNPPPATSTLSAEQRKEAAERRRKRRAARERARKRRAARRARVKLSIQPTAAVFVCLENTSGSKLIDGVILQPGSPSRTFESRRFRMTLGNSTPTLRVNGRDVTVPDAGGTVGFEVTRRRQRVIPAGTRPVCQ